MQLEYEPLKCKLAFSDDKKQPSFVQHGESVFLPASFHCAALRADPEEGHASKHITQTYKQVVPDHLALHSAGQRIR